MCKKQEEFNRLMRECIVSGTRFYEAELVSSQNPSDKVARSIERQAAKAENDAWREISNFIDDNFTPNQQGEIRDDFETMAVQVSLAMFNLKHNPREALLQFEPELALTQWFALFMLDSMAMWKKLGREQVLSNPLGY